MSQLLVCCLIAHRDDMSDLLRVQPSLSLSLRKTRKKQNAELHQLRGFKRTERQMVSFLSIRTSESLFDFTAQHEELYIDVKVASSKVKGCTAGEF